MIEKVLYKDAIFDYAVFDYMYSDLFEFAIENQLDIWTEKKLTIADKDIDIVIGICEASMQRLLDKYYQEPAEKQRCKNPGRYKIILLNGNKYTIDYRLSPVGREVKGMDYFRAWLKKHKGMQ